MPMPSRTEISLVGSLLSAMLLLSFAAQVHATAVFEAPRTFQKAGFHGDIDYTPQAESFVRYGAKAYAVAAREATEVRKHINAFLAEPGPDTLARARQAWRDARPSYQRTEMLRFFNSPIDHPGDKDIPPGPETRINAWPLNEAHIDYVEGAPGAGLIQRFDVPIERHILLRHDQASDETDITTGWHAIEFLLWGQDFNPSGPGDRPWEDYVPAGEAQQRRRRYLQIATDLLVEDLEAIAGAWRSDRADSYAAWLATQAPIEVLGRGLHGAASLAALEIYGERLSVPLDSGSQEDEHSCFSDNTLVDLVGNLEGIEFFVTARYEDESLGPSLLDLVRWRSPPLAGRIETSLAHARSALLNVPEPFDQVILQPADSPARRAGEEAAEAARQVAVALKAAAEVLGIDIVVPGV